MLAGVAATGEDELFSIMSAGIFSFDANIPQMQRNYGPRLENGQRKMDEEKKKSCELHLCQLASSQSALAWREKKKKQEEAEKKREMS